MATSTADSQAAADKKATDKKAFKDWFDKQAAEAMAEQLGAVYSKFDKSAFIRCASRNLKKLEFNGRVKQFSDAMQQELPQSYPKAIAIVVKSLPENPVDAASVTDGWLQWPVGQFIADYGTDHFDESFAAMTELTQRFSSEYAVRPFVERYPQETFNNMRKLTTHPSEHVRRWCSEGTRTRLPWGVKLQDLIDNPAPILPVLDALIDDESDYVRKSVANSINDLSKDHPQLVLKKCRRWQKKSKPGRTWIIKHGLRTLIKQGDSGALELIGYGPPKKLAVKFSALPARIKLGGAVELEAKIVNRSTAKQNLMIDYVVHYVRKNNVVNEKVFKWKTLEIAAREEIVVSKKHPMKPTSIRALYGGKHKVEIQINGIRLAEAEFELL